MKAYDPLKDGVAIARLDLLTAQTRHDGELETLPDSSKNEVLIDKLISEKLSLHSTVYSQEDRDLVEKYRRATREEKNTLRKSTAYKAFVKRARQDLAESGAAEVVAAALSKLIPDEVTERYEANYKALQLVIDVLSELPARPEIAPVSEVVIVLEGVCRALSNIKMWDADMISIAESFAYPAHSFRNSRAASMPRTDKDTLNNAKDVWKQWVANPSLYKTKAAFSLDLIRKEYCADSATPARWIKIWAADLPADHVLQEKIVVKARSK